MLMLVFVNGCSCMNHSAQWNHQQQLANVNFSNVTWSICRCWVNWSLRLLLLVMWSCHLTQNFTLGTKKQSECLIPFGEGHLRGHCNLALASLNGDHTATKVASLAVHFNALLQKLFLQIMCSKNVTLYRRLYLWSRWATRSLKSNKESSNKTNKSLWVSEFLDFKCTRPFCLSEANSSMDYYELFSNCMAASSMATEPWY